ncbi:Protein ALP1-like [Holothuria leucospilota]|uniref:Protein ALP1-like n=1 Tax=Holothuria leucospilota TaxID=206669 RepID=A0A9Q0YJV4_HOLLE|nr:Protein ALP1-like [Holothuria leucospilota]
MAVVDADYNFLLVDVGTPGSIADGGIWRETSLGQALEEGRADFPYPEPLPGEDDHDIPYTLVGDDAFPLKSWMTKPYPHRQMSREQKIFNYRLSRAKRVAENAFGIFASRHRCFLTTMKQEPKNVKTIVYVACVLHNLIRTRRAAAAVMEEGDQVDNQTSDLIPGSWRTVRQAEHMPGLQRMPGNRSHKRAKDQRDHLCTYYNSKLGSVPWQKDMI